MIQIDHSDLSNQTLKTFLAALEEGAVTKAAGRMGVSQSAVSHTLVKLSLIFDDPLFVRDGRGITPSARAQSLRDLRLGEEGRVRAASASPGGIEDAAFGLSICWGLFPSS